jgi:hypothetical protein
MEGGAFARTRRSWFGLSHQRDMAEGNGAPLVLQDSTYARGLTGLPDSLASALCYCRRDPLLNLWREEEL